VGSKIKKHQRYLIINQQSNFLSTHQIKQATMTNPHLLSGLGASLAMFLSAAGSSVASVPAGLMAQHAVGLNAWAPIVISGVLAIYGCIIAVIVGGKLMDDDITEAQGYRNFAAGLAVGLTCLMSGLGMSHFIGAYHHQHIHGHPHPHDPTARANSTEGTLTEGLISTQAIKPMVLGWRFLFVLVFIEAIGLYGLIVALLMCAH
jgi:V-type H+-transporting ATPase 16kDa proteolipid subunit